MIRVLFFGLVIAVSLWAVESGGCLCGNSGGPDGAYMLGVDDKVLVQATNIKEFSREPAAIDASGSIGLPFAGVVQAAGLTTDELRDLIVQRLSKYYNNPEVRVTVTEYHSQPVSVIGAVKTPGVYQLHGKKTLIDMLTTAGGIAPNAGYRVQLTRQNDCGRPSGTNPVRDLGDVNVSEFNLTAVLGARDGSAAVRVCPRDVIAIPKAKLVYVMGEVHKAGGFALDQNDTMSVLKALSLAEGLNPLAGPKNARILRPNGDAEKRQEIRVNLAEILRGKSPDLEMQGDDILLVPNNAAKSATMRGVEAAIQMGVGVVTWRVY